MIHYDNRDYKFLLCQRTGSVLFSRAVLLPPLFSTIFCGFLLSIPDLQGHVVMSDDVGRIYATILAFVIVYRTGFAFNRYFSGVTYCQEMFSKWRDAWAQLSAFMDASVTSMAFYEEKREAAEILERSKEKMLHWFSLLSAIAVETLKHHDDEFASTRWEVASFERCVIENRLGAFSATGQTYEHESWDSAMGQHDGTALTTPHGGSFDSMGVASSRVPQQHRQGYHGVTTVGKELSHLHRNSLLAHPVKFRDAAHAKAHYDTTHVRLRQHEEDEDFKHHHNPLDQREIKGENFMPHLPGRAPESSSQGLGSRAPGSSRSVGGFGAWLTRGALSSSRDFSDDDVPRGRSSFAYGSAATSQALSPANRELVDGAELNAPPRLPIGPSQVSLLQKLAGVFSPARSAAAAEGGATPSDSKLLQQFMKPFPGIGARAAEARWPARDAHTKLLMEEAEEFVANKVQVLFPITPQEREQLENVHDRVLNIIKWILVEISEHSIRGRLQIAPPILSRVYQELSNGMLGFANAMKIVMVPFPMPFAQVIAFALIGFYVICPFIVIEVLNQARAPGSGMGGAESWGEQLHRCGVSLVLNYLCCAGYSSLVEISIQLEEPFGDDVNDFPLNVQQWQFVWALEDIFFAKAPFDIFDLACRPSPGKPAGWRKDEIRRPCQDPAKPGLQGPKANKAPEMMAKLVPAVQRSTASMIAGFEDGLSGVRGELEALKAAMKSTALLRRRGRAQRPPLVHEF